MKTFIKSYLLAIIWISCSSEKTQYSVQDKLKTYVDSFYNSGLIRGYALPKNNLIISTRKGLNKACRCYGLTSWEQGGFNPSAQVTTLIDEDFFNSSDSTQISFTIFHELGHGILKRISHSNSMSIMNPAIRNCDITPEILDELFKGYNE